MSGPKTPAGKARSRMNALKHGLRATDELFLAHLTPRERAIFEDLGESLHSEYKPQTPFEKSLVDRIAIQHFRLYRLYDLENIAIAGTLSQARLPSGRTATLDPRSSAIPHLDRFSRYDGRIERQIRILHNCLCALYLGRGDLSINRFSFRN